MGLSTYITHVFLTHISSMHVLDTYILILLVCESVLVIQFYKSNASSIVVVRNAIALCNKQC